MTRVRGQHQTIALTQNSVQLAASFAKLSDFTVQAKNDLTETDFIGESETDFDFIHSGWGGTFTIHESESSPLLFYQQWVDQAAAGLVLPVTNLIVTTTYIDPGVGPLLETYQSIVIGLDSRTNSGRKDYLKNAFKWACKRRKVSQL